MTSGKRFRSLNPIHVRLYGQRSFLLQSSTLRNMGETSKIFDLPMRTGLRMHTGESPSAFRLRKPAEESTPSQQTCEIIAEASLEVLNAILNPSSPSDQSGSSSVKGPSYVLTFGESGMPLFHTTDSTAACEMWDYPLTTFESSPLPEPLNVELRQPISVPSQAGLRLPPPFTTYSRKKTNGLKDFSVNKAYHGIILMGIIFLTLLILGGAV